MLVEKIARDLDGLMNKFGTGRQRLDCFKEGAGALVRGANTFLGLMKEALAMGLSMIFVKYTYHVQLEPVIDLGNGRDRAEHPFVPAVLLIVYKGCRVRNPLIDLKVSEILHFEGSSTKGLPTKRMLFDRGLNSIVGSIIVQIIGILDSDFRALTAGALFIVRRKVGVVAWLVI